MSRSILCDKRSNYIYIYIDISLFFVYGEILSVPCHQVLWRTLYQEHKSTYDFFIWAPSHKKIHFYIYHLLYFYERKDVTLNNSLIVITFLKYKAFHKYTVFEDVIKENPNFWCFLAIENVFGFNNCQYWHSSWIV